MASQKLSGIILAAGGSRRLGKTKQLLLWKGEALVRHVARLAIESELDPVIVVTGDRHEDVELVLKDLPVIIAVNNDWADGQSTSIKHGLQKLPKDTAACLFMLSDQPQIPLELITKIKDCYCNTQAMIIAPCVRGKRGNPVLFHNATFSDLKMLKGNEGGRSIFKKYLLEYIEWDDEKILIDVDTEESYRRLLELQ
jgi:molybdenum cofactor cytidylyltransferase